MRSSAHRRNNQHSVPKRKTVRRTNMSSHPWTNRPTINPPDAARKRCNWKNKGVIEFVRRCYSCFYGKYWEQIAQVFRSVTPRYFGTPTGRCYFHNHRHHSGNERRVVYFSDKPKHKQACHSNDWRSLVIYRWSCSSLSFYRKIKFDRFSFWLRDFREKLMVWIQRVGGKGHWNTHL